MKIDIEKIKNKKSLQELIDFGVIVIDKPSGPTSFDVSGYVKDKLGVKRTGHIGTLDPAVSGVLPITLNKACRLSPYLTGSRKKYVGIMRLHTDIEDGALKKMMQKFIGKIEQLPPVRSSVKRVLRKREVYSWNFLERKEKDVLFSTEVEAGTYIRTLINDIGKKIEGAHMLELRRISAGSFIEKNAWNLYDFDRAVENWKKGDDSLLREIIIPGEIIGTILPSLTVDKDHVAKYLRGAPIHVSEIKKKDIIKNGKIAVFSKEVFIGCYTIVNINDIYAKAEFIFH
jgi:H/ACA ribonucleoprotein complex subunit 4